MPVEYAALLIIIALVAGILIGAGSVINYWNR